MDNSEKKSAREARQGRVSKVVWGLALIGMGVFLTLHNQGRIDLARHSPYPARNAVDGNPQTRWSSGFSEPQWLTVDLGSTAAIARVRLNWEEAYAKDYAIEASPDGESWTTLATVTDGDGGIDEHEVSASARYVRMLGTRRATPYGFSLWELEVYGTTSPMALPSTEMATSSVLVSRGKWAATSSGEGVNLWLMYWPLLLIVGGLPSILAPKDGGDQAVGLMLTAAGAFLQANKLGLTAWGWRESFPVLLVVAGAILVFQSLRRPSGNQGTPDEHTGTAERVS